MSLPPPRKKTLPPPRKIQPEIPKRSIQKGHEQPDLIHVDEEWKKEWQGMPEFISVEKLPFHTVRVHFDSLESINDFCEKIGQKINTAVDDVKYTPRIWHPKQKDLKVGHLRYKGTK